LCNVCVVSYRKEKKILVKLALIKAQLVVLIFWDIIHINLYDFETFIKIM